MSASEVYLHQDDQDAFAEVYRAHHAKLLRYCQYRLRDRHEAEDVAQEAFARAWRTMPASAFDRNFYPWLRVVASNLCTDILRKRARSEPVAVIDIPLAESDVDRLVDNSDRVLVRQALDRLNDRHRVALIMREGEGLTYDQIAERTGVTSGTVESLLWRARQALKREFTVLAGEGSFVVIPLVAVLAARARSAGRRAWARLAGFDLRGNDPAAHMAVAAVAAISVAAGVVASLSMGGHNAAGSNVSVQRQSHPAAAPARPVTANAASVAAPSTSTTHPAYRAVAWASPASAATAGGLQGGSGTTPFRIVSPFSGPRGKDANEAAKNAPVNVNVPHLAVIGVYPSMVGTYTNDVLKRLPR